MEGRFRAVTVLGFDAGVIVRGNVVVVVVAFRIAWNATNALYELSLIFFCLVVLILVLVECRLVAVAVLECDLEVIVPGGAFFVVVVVVIVAAVASALATSAVA